MLFFQAWGIYVGNREYVRKRLSRRLFNDSRRTSDDRGQGLTSVNSSRE